jgi:uncharacterized protein (TIGR02466 family)
MLHGELEANHHEIAESCRRAVAKVKRRHKGNTAMDYTTYFDGDIREEMQKESWFIDMTNKLKDTYIDYINATYGCRVAHLTRHDVHFFCWVNVYNKAHHHEMHNHVNSYVSGTYYVKTDSDSQPIKFVSPNAMMDFGLQTVAHPQPPKNYMPQNTGILGSGMHESEIMFHPQCGEFLMWPSAMFHSVPPITDFNELPDNYERISISFNLDHARENLEDKEIGDQFHYGTVHKEEDPWDNRSQ